MVMKNTWTIVAFVACVQLAGCKSSPQLPVSFADHGLNAQSGRVGVAMTVLPKVDTSFPGADCLLCMATASTANSSLTKHTHGLTSEDLLTLKEGIAGRLRTKGVDVTVIAEDLNLKPLQDFSGGGVDVAKKDFRPLKEKYKVDRLVIIDITRLGFVRNYSAYISKGEPTADLSGTVSVVNLSTNTYDFFSEINQSKGAEGSWDEPPDFPALTNAYYAVVETGKDAIQQPF
jgi:hypothetical protein